MIVAPVLTNKFSLELFHNAFSCHVYLLTVLYSLAVVISKALNILRNLSQTNRVSEG